MNKPDHRRLGRQLGIYATDELCGSGLPLWLPAGAAIRSEIERYVVDLERRNGYVHVYTPELAKRELFEQSGHWAHYRDDMYPPMQVGAEEAVLRPMNCPHHILVFKAQPRTVREIPFRVAELGTMFRFERSGVVGGLSRVRQMTLNDGHVFCAPDDVGAEIAAMLGMVEQAYRALAIPPPRYRLSLRGEGPKYVGDADMWERAEAMVRQALDGLGLAYEPAEGEAAFYGPKIDLQVEDPQGREETLSTVQVDFHLPAQFDLEYQDGATRRRPVLVHRSIVATMERMVAHILEVHDGALPAWLAPTQVVLVNVVDDVVDYGRATLGRLLDAGIRVELDDRDATLASRVRDAEIRRVPYVLVIGRREADAGSVSIRVRGRGQVEAMPVQAFVDGARRVIDSRSPDLVPLT